MSFDEEYIDPHGECAHEIKCLQEKVKRLEADLQKVSDSHTNLHAECERLRVDESELRRMLAFAYSGTNLYGDDGELQDGRLPMIDYIRDSVTDIRNKIDERGMQQFVFTKYV